MLLDLHMNGDTPLFTFIGPRRTRMAEAALTDERKRERAFATVRDDVAVHRRESQTEQPDAERLADDRYLLAERLRVFLKRLILRMEGDPAAKPPIVGERDNSKYNAMMRTAIELAARIARLQGIETERLSRCGCPSATARGSTTMESFIAKSTTTTTRRTECAYYFSARTRERRFGGRSAITLNVKGFRSSAGVISRAAQTLSRLMNETFFSPRSSAPISFRCNPASKPTAS